MVLSESNITKKALASALKNLIKKRPLEKVSVRDICEECALNRKSFYYHFRDKYDLVEWIFNSEFTSTIGRKEIEERWTFLRALCDYFYQERGFYTRVFQEIGQNSFLRYLEEYLFHIVEASMRLKLPEGLLEDEDYKFCVSYHSGATFMAVVRWMMEDTEVTPEQFVGRLRTIDEIILTSIIKEQGLPFASS